MHIDSSRAQPAPGFAGADGQLRSVSAVAAAPLLFAQSVATETKTDVAARAEELPPPSSEKANDAVAAAETDWFGWGIPPIRWGGQMVTEIRADKTGDQPRRLQQIEIANIKGASYVWQPWFSRVSGGLGLVTSTEFKKESTGLTGDQTQNTRSKALTGNADVALFPVSRFPFNAYFDVSDSRAGGGESTKDSTSTRMGLRQSYRPPEGTDNYTANFNRSTLESSSFGRDTVNAFAASMQRSVGSQAFDLSGSHTRNTRSNTGESTALSNLFARHSYRSESDLSLDSLASLSSSEFHLLSGGVSSDSRSRFIQGNTFATWRPDEDSPLFVTGSARVFQSSIASTAGPTESTTLSANLAATYALSRQTSLSGSAAVTQLRSDAGNRLLTTQLAGVNHVGDPAELGSFAYTWNAGANAGNQTGLAEGSRRNVGGQLGHSLTRGLALGENSQISFVLGQNAGASIDTLNGNARTLSHNGSVSWRVSSESATSAYVSLLGSDSRTFGFNANHFQLINFQATGQLQFSRNSYAAMNLTVQGVRQSILSAPTTPIAPIKPTTPAVPITSSAPTNVNSSGNLSYSHLRAFDVPRLRYTVIYGINESQFKTRLEGDVNAPRERVSQSFEQRLDYALGRVAARLSMRIAMIEGRRDALIFFRLIREFGSF